MIAKGGVRAGRGRILLEVPVIDLAPVGRPTLGQESRSRARERIAHGAATVLAAKGLDATVDDVAETAGVSRRTVFRHFATHNELLAAGINEIGNVIDARMPGPPPPGADVEMWLTEYAVRVHELLRQVIGRAFWDIHIGRSDITSELTTAMTLLTARRHRYACERSAAAWQAMGGEGPIPPWVVDAFAIQCSAFATNAMAVYDTDEAGRVTAQVLWAVLTTAVAEQR